MSSFLETLRSGRVLLMDGAMGTELQRAGIGENECYEAWNLTQSEKVRAIHQAYVDAGAEVLLTNTFQANVPNLEKHRLADKLEQIIESGVELARSVTGSNRFVIATFGPLAEKADMVSSALDGIARMLRSTRGADAWLFETISSISDISSALHCCQQFLVDRFRPVFASWTYMKTPEGRIETQSRFVPSDCAKGTADRISRPHRLRVQPGTGPFPPDPARAIDPLTRSWGRGITRNNALGVNCGRGIGMDEIIEIIRRYREVTDMPLFARPNAGTPTRVGDRWVYPLTPEKMAERLPVLLEAGVSMVGGCCGTTPEHIAAMRPIVDAWNAKRGFKS